MWKNYTFYVWIRIWQGLFFNSSARLQEQNSGSKEPKLRKIVLKVLSMQMKRPYHMLDKINEIKPPSILASFLNLKNNEKFLQPFRQKKLVSNKRGKSASPQTFHVWLWCRKTIHQKLQIAKGKNVWDSGTLTHWWAAGHLPKLQVHFSQICKDLACTPPWR